MAEGDVCAVVLAGGAAQRMGGGDKPLRLLAGQPLLAHVLARVSPQVSRVALNANGDPERFAGYGLPVVPDSVGAGDAEELAGPLAGVLAGLEHMREAAWVLSVPGDAPFLPEDLVARLLEAAGGQEIAMAASPDETGRLRDHPVAALWRPSLAGALRAALEQEGLRKIAAFTERYGCVRVSWGLDPVFGDPFTNLNTPEDLAAAEEVLSMSG